MLLDGHARRSGSPLSSHTIPNLTLVRACGPRRRTDGFSTMDGPLLGQLEAVIGCQL